MDWLYNKAQSQNHNEIPSHTPRDGCNPKKKAIGVGEVMEKFGPLDTVGQK